MRFKPIHPDPDPRGKSLRLDNLFHLKAVSGVYVLRFPDQSYYVGSSSNLFVRLASYVQKLPGAQYAVHPCRNYKVQEQRFIESLRHRGKTLVNINNAVRAPYTPRVRTSFRDECKAAGVPYSTAIQRRLRGDAHPLSRKRKKKYSRWITINGRTRPFVYWCRRAGISPECALGRIREGWTEQDAVTVESKRGRS